MMSKIGIKVIKHSCNPDSKAGSSNAKIEAGQVKVIKKHATSSRTINQGEFENCILINVVEDSTKISATPTGELLVNHHHKIIENKLPHLSRNITFSLSRVVTECNLSDKKNFRFIIRSLY